MLLVLSLVPVFLVPNNNLIIKPINEKSHTNRDQKSKKTQKISTQTC